MITRKQLDPQYEGSDDFKKSAAEYCVKMDARYAACRVAADAILIAAKPLLPRHEVRTPMPESGPEAYSTYGLDTDDRHDNLWAMLEACAMLAMRYGESPETIMFFLGHRVAAVQDRCQHVGLTTGWRDDRTMHCNFCGALREIGEDTR